MPKGPPPCSFLCSSSNSHASCRFVSEGGITTLMKYLRLAHRGGEDMSNDPDFQQMLLSQDERRRAKKKKREKRSNKSPDSKDDDVELYDAAVATRGSEARTSDP